MKLQWHDGVGRDVGAGVMFACIGIGLLWLTIAGAPEITGALGDGLRKLFGVL